MTSLIALLWMILVMAPISSRAHLIMQYIDFHLVCISWKNCWNGMVLYSAAFHAKVLQTLVDWLNWICPLSLPPLWWDPVGFALDEINKLQHWLLYTKEKSSPAERRGRWRFYSWSDLLCDLEDVASLQQLPSYVYFLYPGCWGWKCFSGEGLFLHAYEVAHQPSSWWYLKALLWHP